MPPTDDFSLEGHVGFLLRKAHQRHVAIFVEASAEIGLTPTQFAALQKLAEVGTATQNLLGRLVAMDPATIQGVVRRLIARGFMRTASDPMDRRLRVLTITPEGEAVVREGREAGMRANDALMAPLSEREREQLVTLLRRLSPG